MVMIPPTVPVGEMADSAQLFAEGTYNVRVKKAEYYDPKANEGEPGFMGAKKATTSAKGPGFSLTWVVTGPGEIEAVGRHVFETCALNGDGSWRLREILEQTGHAGDFRIEDTDQLVDLECALVLTQEIGKGQYEGKDKMAVKKHLALV